MSSNYDGHNSPLCRKCICEFNRLEEARFWSRIMMEHALFIKLGLPADEPELIAEAQVFEERFHRLLNELNRVKKLNPELLDDLTAAVEDIIAFKAKILRLQLQCKILPGSNYPLLLDLIRRKQSVFRSFNFTGAGRAYSFTAAAGSFLAAHHERAYRIYYPLT